MLSQGRRSSLGVNRKHESGQGLVTGLVVDWREGELVGDGALVAEMIGLVYCLIVTLKYHWTSGVTDGNVNT